MSLYELAIDPGR